jgi:phage anti-repressor protein
MVHKELVDVAYVKKATEGLVEAKDLHKFLL